MEKNKSKAILYICSSAFFFNLMNIFVRLSGDVPSIQKSFFRNLVAVFVAFFMLIKSGEGFHPQKKNLPILSEPSEYSVTFMQWIICLWPMLPS